MRKTSSTVVAGHRDYELLTKIRTALAKRAGGEAVLVGGFPLLVREAIDFVLDPIRTARGSIAELDNVEKTFIGLKIEHLFRDFLDIPKGLRDLEVDGMDIDVKNTIGETWMIPPETYSKDGPCIVIASEEATHQCWLGIIVGRREYLGAENRDKKCSVTVGGMSNILWLVDGAKYPVSYWKGIDMARFREIRKLRGGTKRAVMFFRENLNKPFHRSVIQGLMFPAHDYMKRLRKNGGARDVLRKEGIALLSGVYDGSLAAKFGYPHLDSEAMVAIAPKDASEERLLRSADVID